MTTLLKRLIILVLMVAAVSCTPKRITYFQDLEAGKTVSVQDSLAELRVCKGDRLSIIVHTRKSELGSMFNLSVSTHRVGSTNTTGNSSYISSYHVLDDGTIDFPEIGSIQVEGLTRNEIVKLVKNKLKELEYFNDDNFVVSVEFENMYITILGEVSHQGRFALTKDRTTLIEALGMAGDMTIQGLRYNVKILRDEDGGKKIYTVDFTNGEELLNSPAYYLHQNDVLYVECNNIRKRQSIVNGNNVRSASFWMSAASFLTSMYMIYRKL